MKSFISHRDKRVYANSYLEILQRASERERKRMKEIEIEIEMAKDI